VKTLSIRSALAASIFLLVAAACSAPAAAALSDADKTAIEAQEQSFAKSMMAGDMAGAVKSYYTSDAVFMPPNQPAVIGAADLEKALKAFPPISTMKMQIEEIVGAGDLAYVRGKYQITMNPPGAPPMNDSGKYLEIFRKQADGSWRNARDAFSSNLPAAPAPAPAPAKKWRAVTGKRKGLRYRVWWRRPFSVSIVDASDQLLQRATGQD
jgi:ketosteroid isomerase-like protein